LTRAVRNPIWKYSLIYSTKFTAPCVSEAEKLQPLSKKVIKGTKAMSAAVKSTRSFKGAANKDLEKWDCDAMYPKPKIMEKPDILGWAKKGYEVYNTVKDLLPEDSAAGPGDVPGTPDSEEELEMFKIIGGETEEEFEVRLKIWRNAKGNCNTDHDAFETAISVLDSAIHTGSTPPTITPLEDFDQDLKNRAQKYTAEAKKVAAAAGSKKMSTSQKSKAEDGIK